MNKEAWKLFKEKLPATLQLSGVFSAFILLVYGLLYLFGYLVNDSVFSLLTSFFGIFDFILMVFLVSFVVSILSPLIYSYFAANSILDTKDEDKVTVGTFLKTYLLGTRDPIKGHLHIFSSLMWGFLVYLGIIFLLLSISYGIMSSNNYLGINDQFNLYQNLIVRLSQSSAQEADAIQTEIKTLISSEAFQKPIRFPLGYSNLIAITFGFYIFAHKVVINIFRYFPSTTLGGVPARPLNQIFKLGFKATRNKFYPTYYKTIYPLVIGFILVFVGTYIGFSFIPRLTNNIYVLNITSITVTSIVMLPFLPVIFNLYNIIWKDVGEIYMETFIQTAENQINVLKQNQARYSEMEQSQLKQAEISIEKSKEIFDKFKEQNKEEDSKTPEDDSSLNSHDNDDNSKNN